MAKPFGLMPAVMATRAKEVGTGITQIVRRAATAIDRELVLSTPVNTGKARSNWVGTLNAPFGSVIPPYAPGVKLGIGEGANAQAAIAQARVAINGYVVGRTKSIHLTNNVSYVAKLNAGSSKQAPALFVQKAIQAGVMAVRGVKRIFRI